MVERSWIGRLCIRLHFDAAFRGLPSGVLSDAEIHYARVRTTQLARIVFESYHVGGAVCSFVLLTLRDGTLVSILGVVSWSLAF